MWELQVISVCQFLATAAPKPLRLAAGKGNLKIRNCLMALEYAGTTLTVSLCSTFGTLETTASMIIN